jgi:two-component system cell cycle sensor histidine kinase/response regulator CckA
MVLSAYTLTFPLLRLLSPRLGFRATAVTLLLLLMLTGFVVEARGGVGVGNIFVNAMVIVLGALFFGRRGAALGLIVVVGLFVLAGVIVMKGWGPPITKSMWDSTTTAFWVRGSIAFALVGLAFTLVQVYIVERLATEAKRLQGLVEQEQRQRLALEAAEREQAREREQRLRMQKALDESRRVEALARMAGGIAHDFNNALTVVMGAAESVRMAQSLPEATVFADEIVEGARKASELTRQLLTLGRQQGANPRPTPLAPLFERLQTALRRVLPDDVVLDVVAPAEDLVLHVDPSELERALFNLVLNARDAMPGGGRLRIVCEHRAPDVEDADLLPGRYGEIRVSDTGEGVAPEHIEHIFDPFFTTKSAGKGTGLGLATVYAFAKDAGGGMRVESTVGKGSTFSLILPESVELAATALFSNPGSPSSEHLPPGSNPGPRVLVVEDNPVVRENMVRILRRDGCEVEEAPDGDRALEILESGTAFSVLCIDGVMPGASTRTVIQKTEHRLPSARVLLCSGYLREELLRRGVAAGRYTFLPKPFSAQDLVSAVRRLSASAG